jgi:cytochrome P450
MDSRKKFLPIDVRRLDENASTFFAIRRLMDNPVEVLPEKLYREFVFERSFAGRRTIHISDPELIQAILLTHQDVFPKSTIEHRLLSSATGNGLLTAEGDDWRDQRKASAPAFRQDRLKALMPEMNAAGHTIAQDLKRCDGATDVLPFMTKATFQIIASTLLSGDGSELDQDRIARDVALFLETLGKIDMIDFLPPPLRHLPRPWGAAGRAAVKRLRADADQAIAQRRQTSQEYDDLLGFMMSARNPDTGQGLTDIELRDNIITFIGAGHETTSLALTWCLYLLANAPEWMARLKAEAFAVCGTGAVTFEALNKLVQHEWVIKEAMRLFPPAPLMARAAARDLELGNLSVHQGDQIVLAVYAMHRHVRLWDWPRIFDPLRFSPAQERRQHRYQFLPFSGGPRICIGMRFAMIEAITILAHIVRAVAVSPASDFIPSAQARITLRPARGMLLNVTAVEK